MGVEYTVIDDIARVDEIWQEAYNVMEQSIWKNKSPSYIIFNIIVEEQIKIYLMKHTIIL